MPSAAFALTAQIPGVGSESRRSQRAKEKPVVQPQPTPSSVPLNQEETSSYKNIVLENYAFFNTFHPGKASNKNISQTSLPNEQAEVDAKAAFETTRNSRKAAMSGEEVAEK